MTTRGLSVVIPFLSHIFKRDILVCIYILLFISCNLVVGKGLEKSVNRKSLTLAVTFILLVKTATQWGLRDCEVEKAH